MDPEQARAAARRGFGNVTRAQERFYERRRLLWADHLRQDVRCALRNIRHYPFAALVAVISLAGGIGATTVTLMIARRRLPQSAAALSPIRPLSRVQIGTPIARHADRQLRARRALRELARAPRPPSPRPRCRAACAICGWPIAPSPYTRAAGDAGVLRPARHPPRARPVARTRDVTRRAAPPALLSYRVWERLFTAAMTRSAGRSGSDPMQPDTIVGVLPRPFWFSDWGSRRSGRCSIRGRCRPTTGSRWSSGAVRRGCAGAARHAVWNPGSPSTLRGLPSGQRELRSESVGIEARRSPGRWHRSSPMSSGRPSC